MRPSNHARATRSMLALALVLAFGGTSSAHAQIPSFLMQTGLFGDTSARTAELDRQIAEQVSRVEQLEAERARAEAEASALTSRRAETNRRLRDRARSLYRLTRAGALPLAGGFEALLTHLGRRARLERIVRGDLEAMNDLRERATALREESSTRAAELESARAQLRALEAEKTQLSQGGLMAQAGGFFGGPSVVASGPTYGLQQTPVVPGDSYGLRVVDGAGAPSATFESQRGQLMIPLLSPTAMREATREEGAGLEIEGPSGASVRAAADGRVAFAHTHATYGRLVIVDHGQSFFTIYGGLGRIDVSVGQTITRGSSIGSLESGALFFQVRRGTRALEARSWLGL
ncbi:MAG: peptidoglycan DD-metalloendopeptidase family protein [Sandaracinaceae bacterium]|nr:peptidoglycan DD-metalloendopeptidase family protein [Sandaracinaceae bacterium]